MHAQERIIQWIRDRNAGLNDGAEEITYNTNLLDSGLLDSLGFLHLVTFIEEEYELEIPIDMLAPDNFSTPEVTGRLIENIVNSQI